MTRIVAGPSGGIISRLSIALGATYEAGPSISLKIGYDLASC